MQEFPIKLLVLSPEKTVVRCSVAKLHLPGEKAPFTVMYNHAPIISSLAPGTILWSAADGEHSLAVSGGFAEVKDNVVTVCVEVA